MNLSKYFTLEEATQSETAARLGIRNLPNEHQLKSMKIAASKLDLLRKNVGPIYISSWLRVTALNIVIPGSAKNSSHQDGWAIDCYSPTYTPLELCGIASELYKGEFDQIIHEYGNWMHISFDPKYRCEKFTIFRNSKNKKYIVGFLTESQYLAA